MTLHRTTSTVAAALLVVGLAAAALTTAPAATAATAATASTGGGRVTGPTPVPAPPFDLAAGDVCAFGIHAQFPVNRQVAWTATDASGRTVAQYVQGTLTGVITRTDTGRSVTRDLSGRGVFTYAADGSSAITGYGSALIGFHAGDRPSHQLLVLAPRGVARIDIAADGHRTLTFGGGEDLCRTLG